jgi:5-methylcytosine-specific restriction enzyme B
VADFTVSTNLISWIPAMHGIFGWPESGLEAVVIREMTVGDVLVPKFAQSPVHEDQEPYQRAIADVFDDDYNERRAQYEEIVNWGAGAVPFVMRISKHLGDDDRYPSNESWACVAVEIEWLDHPISTSEYLRLRTVPVELAGQFKAMAAPNKHIQQLPDGSAAAVLEAGRRPDRGAEFLRRESLVRADTAAAAESLLQAKDMGPDPLDRAFLVTAETIAGLFVCEESGKLKSSGESIATKPADLRPLLEAAGTKAVRGDYFKPARALHGADQLAAFLSSSEDVLPITEFAHFHDRYVILPRKVTEALDIAARPDPGAPPDRSPDETTGDDDDDVVEEITLDKLLGLSVEAVEASLPDGMVLPRSVLAEAVTAVRSGKHLLFSGPPGTGKSTVAAALCKAVVGSDYRVATATADWTTFDTIGGYVPDADGLTFEPGIVLRCLTASEWLMIDELNRADIDKAFGPLFTLLAGSGNAQETVLLPYKRDAKNIEIGWADTLDKATTDYTVTKAWRLLGTMNVTDKASLFQLSFAFLRRFAVIDVPLPEEPDYRALFLARLGDLDPPVGDLITDAAMRVAFGPVELGPAILLDVAAFTKRGLVPASSGTAPYEDPIETFLTALRLYAVPQYEGADASQIDDFAGRIKSVIAQPPPTAWSALEAALAGVALQ